MNKQEKNRPNIRDIFREGYIKQIMKEFIDTNGKSAKLQEIPIKFTNTHMEIKHKGIQSDKVTK